MRAILNSDGRIKKLTVDPNLGVEVGIIPKGVDLSALRWDGEKLVNLLELEEFYVNVSTKILYSKQLPGTQKVKMKYHEKDKLILDGDKLRVKTNIEIKKEKDDEYKARRRKEYPSLGDQLDVIWKYIETLNTDNEEINNMLNEIQKVKDKWPKK